MDKEVVSAFPIDCYGSDPQSSGKKISVSITVFKDGTREVACPYMTAGDDCDNNKRRVINPPCIQLNPQSKSS